MEHALLCLKTITGLFFESVIRFASVALSLILKKLFPIARCLFSKYSLPALYSIAASMSLHGTSPWHLDFSMLAQSSNVTFFQT